jgi:hypothetical protein
MGYDGAGSDERSNSAMVARPDALRPVTGAATATEAEESGAERRRFILDEFIPPRRSATAQQALISAVFAPAEPQHVAQQWRYVADG